MYYCLNTSHLIKVTPLFLDTSGCGINESWPSENSELFNGIFAFFFTFTHIV